MYHQRKILSSGQNEEVMRRINHTYYISHWWITHTSRVYYNILGKYYIIYYIILRKYKKYKKNQVIKDKKLLNVMSKYSDNYAIKTILLIFEHV